ncbi:MAG: Transketolase central region [Clostridia bacterium]|nr:Transketolase central region [Clostridia bacterium]
MAENKALRDAYGEGLAALGKEYPNLFVLDADLTKSTKTETFKKAFPERFINCGIAEGNMMSVAAGMASCGNIVFASTFAMFAAGRAYEQIRNSIAYPKNNVKIVATHAGLTIGEDGATHQCLEDIALMRAIPGMVVISPSDAIQTKAALKFACEYKGPVYIRLGRLPVPVVYKEDYKFILGKSDLIEDGNFVTLMYTGPFYTLAQEIREILLTKNLSARIVDMCSIKPIDEEAVVSALNDTGMIVTIEDHNIYGGLGGAVSECAAGVNINKRSKGTEVLKIGSQDHFGKSGTPAELLEQYGFNAKVIAKKIIEIKRPELLNDFNF